MAKKVSTYVSELKRMIRERTGENCEAWLLPQVRSTAMNMVMLDKVQDELTDGNLIMPEVGVAGQTKMVQNPLMGTYKDLHRTLLLQFEALGLNYKATPSKVTESAKKGGAEHDKLAELINDAKNLI